MVCGVKSEGVPPLRVAKGEGLAPGIGRAWHEGEGLGFRAPRVYEGLHYEQH